MTWREQERINKGNKYRWPALALIIAFYFVMAWAFIESLKFDPFLPVLIIFAMILLVPMTVFVVELLFFTD